MFNGKSIDLNLKKPLTFLPVQGGKARCDEDDKEIAYGQEQNRLAINHFEWWLPWCPGHVHDVHGGTKTGARLEWSPVPGPRPQPQPRLVVVVVSGTCWDHVVCGSRWQRLHFYY